MNEWGVVLVIISLIGLVTAIVTPLLKLNTAITKLNVTLSNLDNLVNESKEKQATFERESNEKFEQHEHRLTEHTVKIKNLEREVFKENKGGKQ